jgi:aryl-alcohol dehydrogenase-like predicted oxidoreductase
MRQLTLGRTGLQVSALGYGTWAIGKADWGGVGDDEAALASMRRAIELGVTLFDTALAYGDGHSERLVGQVVRDAGDGVRVATKVPPKTYAWPPPPGAAVQDVLPGDWIVASTEASLRNLGVDAIDLQQLHVWSDDWVGQGDWLEAVEALRAAGKFRHFGVSVNFGQPENVLRLLETGVIDTVQVLYNVFDQSAEDVLFPAVRAANVGVIARVPFDEGGLTGRIRADSEFAEGDFRRSYFRGDRRREVAERVDAIARDLQVPVEQVPEIALRFCLSDPAVSTVIAGMRSLRNVEANARAVAAGPLSAGELAALRPHRWLRDFYSA